MECVMDKSEVLISVNRRISSRKGKVLIGVYYIEQRFGQGCK